MSGWRIAALALVLTTAAACLNYEDTLVLFPDGSGTFTMRYSVDVQTLSSLEMMIAGLVRQKDPEKERPFKFPVSFKKEEIEKQFQTEGVKVKTLEVKDADGKRHVHLEITFDNPERLAKIKHFDKQPIKIVKAPQKDGTVAWELERKLGIDQAKLPPIKGKKNKPVDPEAIKGIFALFEPSMEGHTVKLNLVLPHPIQAANAKEKKEGKAHWTFPLGAMIKGEQVLTARATIPGEKAPPPATEKTGPPKDEPAEKKKDEPK